MGFEQRASLSRSAANDDIRAYGEVVKETLDASGIEDAPLRAVADRCLRTDRRRISDVQELQLALASRRSNRLYIIVIAFLAVMVTVLAWLLSRPLPAAH